MKVPTVGLLPELRLTNPDAVPLGPTSTHLDQLSPAAACGRHHRHARRPCLHLRAERPLRRLRPRRPAEQWANIKIACAPPIRLRPVWSTEGSWGDTRLNLPDTDLQMAFIARYYLVGWSLGFSRMYWYAADNSWGRLIYPSGIGNCHDRGTRLGCATPATVAWSQVFAWMVGNTMTSPRAAENAVWSCELTRPDGKLWPCGTLPRLASTPSAPPASSESPAASTNISSSTVPNPPLSADTVRSASSRSCSPNEHLTSRRCAFTLPRGKLRFRRFLRTNFPRPLSTMSSTRSWSCELAEYASFRAVCVAPRRGFGCGASALSSRNPLPVALGPQPLPMRPGFC